MHIPLQKMASDYEIPYTLFLVIKKRHFIFFIYLMRKYK
ncbi:hypothetical protein A464_2175 [Salmonella bongori N268-08]|uniref:Uncharacterized protein n=1 Tax=Salmonella bongori N268-08 TaxID=1197719 RepID=S5N9T3_SALBN|nr:hypothetical protein A464_2175 [Salmonella bongori N268-08]